MDPKLWEHLKSLFPGWVHFIQPIESWAKIGISLTNRVLNILYGPTVGTPSVQLSIVSKFKEKNEFVFYAWNKLINVIGDPSSYFHMIGKKNFLAVFKGINSMVQIFLSMGRPNPLEMRNQTSKQEPLCKPIDGNTILNIFGKFLFEPILANKNDFEEGTSLAVEIICNIFCTCNATNYKKEYLSRFYASMIEVLQGKVGQVLISALRKSQSLFTYDYPGIHILIPSFIYAIERTLFAVKFFFFFFGFTFFF